MTDLRDWLKAYNIKNSMGGEQPVQQPFPGAPSSGTLLPTEFRIAANCCSCLRELTPSFS